MTTPYQAPTAPWPDGAGPGGYTSPIPVTPTGLGNALRSEWTKIRTVRSTMWTLGVLLVLVIGIGLLVAGVMSGTSDLSPQPALSAGFFGVLLGSLCVITLGVLVVTSEYGTGMMRTTLTACPSRSRMLTAKALVFCAVAFVTTTVAATVVALADSALLTGGNGAGAVPAPPMCATPGAQQVSCGHGQALGGMLAPTTDQWLRATVGIGLYVALLGLLSLAVGTMLRHSAGAITTMLGLVLLPLILALFMAGNSLEPVRNALIEYCVPNGIATLYDNAFMSTGPQGWDPLWILLAVTAVALGGAYAVLDKRDV
ncbi:ABC transporter permease subunit [Streptomyces sp. SL13]|uniref:ABC transporter permease subunit n=1 Tax=Streptantibioticus silvisoli TaxID=2705255 RepID=A0AA90GZV8_9ACTN|nr:ABC transporter permease subunit [Streptantibioticus silvisoli]MDI5968299.1 ABC transporter permease subunit [Streptantibioticus silvisoli]